MELKLVLAHNNMCCRLDCVKIKKCVCVYIYCLKSQIMVYVARYSSYFYIVYAE
jgi:hypothetical protein